MLTRPNTTCATALLLTAAAVGQAPAPEPAQVDPQRQERRYQGSYSESVSRDLFRACDEDSDDRLDLFEVVDAFEAVRTAGDHAGFARFDADRDGFVSWPEFDMRFRSSLASTGGFRVRTVRSFTMPDTPPQKETPLRQFLRTFDADGDGSLSPTEIQTLLVGSGLPAALSATLMASDLDGSGSIDEAELAPWFQALPLAALGVSSAPSPLPQPWSGGDEDKNGVIDARELQTVLRALDPGLLRWSAELFARLDADTDGNLTTKELAIPAPGGEPAKTAENSSRSAKPAR